MPEKRTIVITISRQMASGGAYIGHLVARELGYKYVEREVLYRAAAELGVDIPGLAGIDECCSGFVDDLMKSFMFGAPEAPYIPPVRRPVYDRELFETESRIIRAIADQYNAVIVGHCGYCILGGRPGLVNIYIHAPKDFRAQRLRSFHSMPAEEARAEIEESDQRRSKFIKTMSDSDWDDARNYHLCIDAQAIGFEAAQRMIVSLAEKMKRDMGV